MTFLTLFAAIEQVVGNLFAILAAIGSFLMLFTSFSDDDSSWSNQIKQWGIGGTILGALGQFSIFITGTGVERIGIFYPLSLEYVNNLLFLAFGFLILRVWLRSNRYRFA